ncbi:hypothetical protein EFA69_09460 [Rufibacter immobilis]|uniref:IS1 family transposase n=1 Tax=Rufibacter immobilis TaxID=1348778 RepID=A0A3M9MWA6_9BACT|nr:hypothetical protein EFA69_09460 [Rufibacter immobilis]
MELLGQAQEREVLAFVCLLLRKLEGVEIGEYCADHWEAFAQMIPAGRHRVCKAYAKDIEGVNTYLRARNRRLVRKTTCFSNKKEIHDASSILMFNYRNNQKTKHHTL